MSSRTTTKYRTTLQIASIVAATVFLAACAHVAKTPPHPTSGDLAKTLKYVETIGVIPAGIDSIFKDILLGEATIKLNRPIAVGLRDDLMYIADAGEGMIFSYSLTDKRIEPVTSAGEYIENEATDIYVAKDHSFFVTDIDGRRALRLSPSGRLLQEYFDSPNMSRPVSISVDEAKSEVLIADEVYSSVIAFDLESGDAKYGVGGRGEGPGKFRIITDMIHTPDAFYISDRIELKVQILNREGKYLAHFGQGQITFPSALALDQYGRIYVAEKADSRIKVFKKGQLVDVIGKNGYGAGEFRFISDMKVHKNKLYVVDSLNSRIQVFDILPEAQASL